MLLLSRLRAYAFALLIGLVSVSTCSGAESVAPTVVNGGESHVKPFALVVYHHSLLLIALLAFASWKNFGSTC